MELEVAAWWMQPSERLPAPLPLPMLQGVTLWALGWGHILGGSWGIVPLCEAHQALGKLILSDTPCAGQSQTPQSPP